MQKDKKIILFDFFGVICSEVAPVWFREHFQSKNVSDLEQEYVRPADTGEISETSLFERLAALIRSTSGNIRKEWFSYTTIDQDVVTRIVSLRDHHEIVLCSNASSPFLRQILKENNIEHLFDRIIVSSEIGVAKPDVRFFERVIAALHQSPTDLIFIDDNPANVAAAQSLGIESHVFKTVANLDFLIIS